MLTKRVIPCLDVKDGRVVKGTNFVNLIDAGDPVEAAALYNKQGADELVLLDITATHEGRTTMVDVVSRVAEKVFIPFAVGGGIGDLDWIKTLLRHGADKVSINSAAVRDSSFIRRAADRFGSQCITVAIDVKKHGKAYHVYINGGRIDTGIDAIEWAKTVEECGAGEILLTSMDTDGTKSGFDTEILKQISSNAGIPVIASGGAGMLEHFSEAILTGGADAVLAASLFHFGILTVGQVKGYLAAQGIPVRK
ncbi:MAG: imidazole glycerol phosphate synthase subunit HisF [Christensenellales bacterium]